MDLTREINSNKKLLFISKLIRMKLTPLSYVNLYNKQLKADGFELFWIFYFFMAFFSTGAISRAIPPPISAVIN